MALTGCASTNYSQFHGSKVEQGTGGTVTSVEGIDIWRNGTPDRKYRVLGIIDDSRGGDLIPMAGIDQGLAEKAKAEGGQAVIVYGSQDQLTGLSHYAYGYTADTTHTTKAAVIKYVN